MFPRAFRIARVSGVEVRIDPTWIFIALLVVWTFFSRFAEGRSVTAAVVMAIIGMLLFFGSVLAHELAHALEAQHRGVEVRGITLFLFGGVTEMHLEAERPFDEFAISAVGPYTSLVAAALFGVAATVANAEEIGWTAVGDVAGLLGWLNVVLALFNLVPGSPLDGGRVLRSIVWAITKDRHRAVRVASYAGQGVAILLWLLAVRAILTSPAGVFDALWAWFIGWFLWQAAVSERRHAETEQLIEGRTVASLATATPPRLPADRPLSLVVDQIASSPGFDIYPVVAEDGDDRYSHDGQDRIVGALHLPDVLEMDPTDRNFRTAGEVMRPIERIPSIHQEEPLKVVLRRIQDEPLLKVLAEDGRVTGLVSRRQVTAALQRLHELQGERRRTGAERLGPGS